MIALSKKSKIQAIIVDEIKSGRLKPGQKLENERDLSNRLGVSRVTLSRGLKSLVDQGVLIKKVGSGTYVSMEPVIVAPSDRKLSFGVVISDQRSPLVLHLINGLRSVLSSECCDIILKDPGGKPELERKMARELMEDSVDGIIVATCHKPDSEEGRRFYEDISKVCPFVMTDCVVNGRIPLVATNNYQGGRMAAELLAERSNGASCYWYVKIDSQISSLKERLQGFRDYIEGEKGGHVEEIVVRDSEKSSSDSFMDVLNIHALPDGVFVSQDMLLNLLIKAVKDKRINLDQLNICAFDNFHGVADLFDIPYVQQPFDEIGAEIARYMSLSRKEKNKPIKQILLMPRLIKGTSKFEKQIN